MFPVVGVAGVPILSPKGKVIIGRQKAYFNYGRRLTRSRWLAVRPAHMLRRRRPHTCRHEAYRYLSLLLDFVRRFTNSGSLNDWLVQVGHTSWNGGSVP